MRTSRTPALAALAALLCVAAAVLGVVASDTRLHELMTTEELVQVFGQSLAEDLPDYEVVFLPTPHPMPVELEALVAEGDDGEALTDGIAFPYEFHAFGSPVGLKLRRNHQLIAPSFKVVLRGGESNPDPEAVLADAARLERGVPRCHFLHRDGDDAGMVAAVSLCHPRSVHGLILRGNESLEIWPLPQRLQDLQGHADGHAPHVVKRVPLDRHRVLFSADDAVTHQDVEAVLSARKQDPRGGAHARLVLETALFLDEAAYRLFAPFVSNDEAQLRDMMLAYLNGVQALYHHPSLGRALDIVLVRLELFRTQPYDLQHHDGDRGPLLDSFCEYNERHNPRGDDDPAHWDMGLYVSGLDFFAYENGRKSGVTMGLATVGGVCLDRYACVIAELGTVNVFGKPYPSAGFTSVYILAHEIGHNLGMHHDSTSNSCPKDGYIMSPSRGTQGEAVWSTCSSEVLQQTEADCLLDRPRPAKGMDHMAMFKDEPGQAWSAKKQCEMLLRDHDAELRYPSRLAEICDNLQCRTPHRSGFYFAGPALTGTSCGTAKWCQGGQCVAMKRKKPVKVVKGGWSPWRSEPCQSGCIAKARGFQKRRRSCTNPRPVNTDEGCEGPSVDVVLCKDDNVCSKTRRQKVVEYASAKCRHFATLLPDLDAAGAGLQAPHEQGRLWMACAIFCRRRDTGSYYTPRLDLNDMGVDAYFPDGTWCHGDSSGSYYCQQRHCLPEGFQISKLTHWLWQTDDVPVPQNALPHPDAFPHPPLLLSYLGLGADGRPLLDQLPPGAATPPPDDAWSDRDYVELPAM
ncbi:A disintegrin and metalloproteinase with thrombospondin motifs adt-1-like [Thrips palmi]|uniref:A disintegrin and metalloproteinase with thrombospondin motifs adt-1-like n=1 Tax=Thrips palmi TaxID=161013 RepID=A0A6P8ZKR7_THRPL|nr:A disintegrin and metalloproteinase with thrombospondin motifs adt-1-like [Thrips palmi]